MMVTDTIQNGSLTTLMRGLMRSLHNIHTILHGWKLQQEVDEPETKLLFQLPMKHVGHGEAPITQSLIMNKPTISEVIALQICTDVSRTSLNSCEPAQYHQPKQSYIYATSPFRLLGVHFVLVALVFAKQPVTQHKPIVRHGTTLVTDHTSFLVSVSLMSFRASIQVYKLQRMAVNIRHLRNHILL